LTNRLLKIAPFRDSVIINLKKKYSSLRLVLHIVSGYIYAFRMSAYSPATFLLHPYGALSIRKIICLLYSKNVSNIYIDNTLFASTGKMVLEIINNPANSLLAANITIDVIAHNIEHDFLLSRIIKGEYRFIPLYLYSRLSDLVCLHECNCIYTFTQRDQDFFKRYTSTSRVPLRSLISTRKPVVIQPNISCINASKLRLLLFGSANRANVYNLRLCHHILKKYDFLHIFVAGGLSTAKETIKLKSHPSFTLLGKYNVLSELAPYVDYAFIPDQIGAGIKMRVMDAIENGIPALLSTEASIGYEELLGDPQYNIVVYKSHDSICDFLVLSNQLN